MGEGARGAATMIHVMSDWRQDMLLTANELARLDDAQRALWSGSSNSTPSESAASASAAEGAEDA